MRRTRRRVLTLSSLCGLVLIPAAVSALTVSTAQAAVAPTKPPAKTPTSISARVYLASRNQAALDRAVAAVSNPASASYGKYLTPAQYRSRFGPTSAATARVSSWLRSTGLKVSAPQQNGRYLAVSGSVVSIERAFGSKLSLLHPGASGAQAAAKVPPAMTPFVLTVTGLDASPARVKANVVVGAKQPAVAKPAAASSTYPAGYRTAAPCSLWYGQLKATTKAGGKVALPSFGGKTPPYTVCGYQPAQLRGAYGAPSSLTGKGVTVAVIDAYESPTLLKDANQYAVNTGTKPFAAGQFASLVPAGGYADQEECDAADWSAEQSLDVEAVHGFAPGANVLYAAARTCSDSDLFDVQAAVVDDNRASIVSLSYGSLESSETPVDAALDTALFKQAALQGIGFYIASGDNGDELISTGEQQVDSSGSNPYATAVGGTSLGIGQGGRYEFETGWGTQRYSLRADGQAWIIPSFVSGAGGGTSALFDEPSYQLGVVSPVIHIAAKAKPAATLKRMTPDVGMLADPNTGMIVGLTQQFVDGVRYGQYRIGGTSLASPLFAAAQALASQDLKTRLGFANPRLYAIFKKQAAGGPKAVPAFNDVTPASGQPVNARADYTNGVSSTAGLDYSIRTLGQDTSLATRKGWDDVTGLGSPAAGFYSATGR